MTASPKEAPTLRYPDSSVFYRDLERTYRVAKRAAGAWIEADDGNRWLDACGGALTISVGHGRPEVVQAAARPARRRGATCTAGSSPPRRWRKRLRLLVAALPPCLPGRQGLSHPRRGGGRRDRHEAGARPRPRHRPSRNGSASSPNTPATTATPWARSQSRGGIRSASPLSAAAHRHAARSGRTVVSALSRWAFATPGARSPAPGKWTGRSTSAGGDVAAAVLVEPVLGASAGEDSPLPRTICEPSGG